jgi:triosephosphate isomerase
VPFTSLADAVRAAAGSQLRVYAQNMHQAAQGAYTGEISAAHKYPSGCESVFCKQ